MRPWDGETMKGARTKADAAFEMFSTLGFPFFTFHDRDVVPEGENLAEFGKNLAGTAWPPLPGRRVAPMSRRYARR